MKRNHGPSRVFLTRAQALAAPFKCWKHGVQKLKTVSATPNGNWHRRCPSCMSEYRERNRGNIRSYQRGWKAKNIERMDAYRKARIEAKFKVLSLYGGACVCCGENFHGFLELDHVNDDGGGRRRRKVQWSTHLSRGRQNDLQLLCRNCNFRKHLNGGVCDCPFGAKSAQAVGL